MNQGLIQNLFKNGINIQRSQMTDNEVKALKINGIVMATDDIVTGEYDELKGEYKYYRYKVDAEVDLELKLKQYELLSKMQSHIYIILIIAVISFVGSIIGAAMYLFTLTNMQV